MKRSKLAALSFLSIPLLAAAALPASAASAASQASSQAHVARASSENYNEPLCQSKKSMCVDAQHYPNGQYVGHDEPSVLFKSGIPGSGNDMTYTITLPRDPKTQPNASGAGAMPRT